MAKPGEKAAEPIKSTASIEKLGVGAQVKVIHMHQGVELLGSAASINNRKAELICLPHGIACISKTTQKVVVVPFANIRGYELV